MSDAHEALRDFTRTGMSVGTPINRDTLRAAVAEFDAQAARIAALEAENERLTRYAATQAASKRIWQQISENTAGEHDETLARVKQLEAALIHRCVVKDYDQQCEDCQEIAALLNDTTPALAPGEAGRSSDG